ncbi:MAG TPA: TonB-dependent receptor [Bryobacteraceae bacterium]|nr:TonB-dependent receptor [Bryobacteraceae bacterium]
MWKINRLTKGLSGCRAAGLAAFLAPALFAQQATIRGVVTDSSRAVIPKVKVTVTNKTTSVSQTIETNDSGVYVAPFLSPGPYRVEASKPGFATVSQDNLKLDVEQTARVDFTLQVGAVTETVNISAAAALIDSQTSVVGQVISNKSIVDLPLNGRNYLELARLTAAVVPARGSREDSKGAFSAVGQHGSQTNISLDGVDNSARLSGGILGNEAQIVTPSIDSVSEFKVVTNNNSAEYGFRLGGMVIVSTKSGGNQLHGTLYEFLRNEKLDGANFFAVGRPKPPFRQNQFGGTAGGRIIRDRTFFFVSYEGTRIRLGQSRTSTLPIDPLRNGDFTGARTIYDWNTTRPDAAGRIIRDPFPSNRIPANRFDPVARRVIDLYPAVNGAGRVNNFFFSPTQSDDTDQIDTRLDHSFTPNHRIFGRYSRRLTDRINPGPLPLPADGGAWATEHLIGHSGVMNLNSVLSPAINNEFRAGLTRGDTVRDLPWQDNFNQKLGINGITDLGDFNQRGMARFAPSGYATVGATTFWPNVNNLDLFQLSDNMLLIHGHHAVKVGFDFRREDLFRRAARFARGFFGFDGSFSQDPNNRGATGDAMADFLLGAANSSTIGNPNGETAITHNYSAFAQDDWRLTTRLTLNLGVRWDMFGPPSFRNFKETPVSNFIFTPGSQQYQIVRPKDESDCGCDRDLNNFAPRVGLAYQLTPKTVVRSGLGLFYGQPDAISFFGDARFQNLPPEFTEITFPTDRLSSPSRVVSAGFPANLIPATTVLEDVFVNTAPRFIPTQYSTQWFLDVQRELPLQTVLTVSYIGNENHNMTQIRNINQPLKPGPGTVKSRSPHPFFGWIVFRDPSGNGVYNALTAKVEKRYSQGLTMMTAYTWSHAIDNVAEALTTAGGQELQDSYDLRRNRANSSFDLRHAFVMSALYELPFGRGRQWLTRGGPLDWVLGGWQVGGILTLRSGQPFTATVSTDISNTGTSNPTGGVSNQNHPNQLRDGNLPSGQRTIDRWFDVGAFGIPANFTYGNGGRNTLTGPGFHNLDFKIGKNFVFLENKRVEFRAEAFNVSNTPHFGLPAANVNLATAGRISAAGAPRQIQLGLKFVF